jgi:hypothetical protein
MLCRAQQKHITRNPGATRKRKRLSRPFRVLLQVLGISANYLERETGIEPATSSLGSWHSTAELLPLAG